MNVVKVGLEKLRKFHCWAKTPFFEKRVLVKPVILTILPSSLESIERFYTRSTQNFFVYIVG